MDNLEFIESLHTLPVADSNPQPPDLERRSTFNGSLHCKSLSIPSVLNTKAIIPADDTSQRRLDQFSVKENNDNFVFMPDFRALLAADGYPLSPDLNEQSNLSPQFVHKLIPDPKVLDKEIKPPAYDMSQRRLDQFSVKENNDNFVFMPDFRALLAADGYPLSPDLNEQSNLSPQFVHELIPDPKVLDKEIKPPAYDMSQCRLDQFSARENNDDFVFMHDFLSLLIADRYPLPPDLIEQSNLSPPFAYKLIPDPPVLDKEIKFPADDMSQHRLDQLPIKPVTSPGEACLVGAGHSSHGKLSFLESPSSATAPESESSMAPSTDSELMQLEEIGADIDKLTPLEKAELELKLAKKHKAPLKRINQLTNKFYHEKRKMKKSMQLKKLEAKLPPEQISQIKNKSLKYVSDNSQKYNFVMKHLTKHADEQLTKNHTLEDLCDAIVYGKKIGLDGAEYKLFSQYKACVDSTFSSRKCRKFHAEYIKRLSMANEITE